jgi:hypothetical protein
MRTRGNVRPRGGLELPRQCLKHGEPVLCEARLTPEGGRFPGDNALSRRGMTMETPRDRASVELGEMTQRPKLVGEPTLCERGSARTLERVEVSMRVLVTGASGSGTTTLGRALSEELKVAFFDVDDYFWLPTDPPYQQQRDSSARLSLLVADLTKVPRSVTSGSVINWGAEIEDSFSFIAFLALQPELRLSRLREREVARFGRANEKFLQEAAHYDNGHSEDNSRIGDERWLARRSCPVLRIEGDVSVQEGVARMANALSNLHLQPIDAAAPEVRR